MLIRSRSRSSRRHHRERRDEDTATFRLQAGAAKVALEHRRSREARDAHGQPMPLAQGLAEGYSERALERMVRRRNG